MIDVVYQYRDGGMDPAPVLDNILYFMIMASVSATGDYQQIIPGGQGITRLMNAVKKDFFRIGGLYYHWYQELQLPSMLGR
jgi:hypothetical protein